MNKINPLKSKYYDLYKNITERVSKESVAKRRQVGAVIVLPSGLISLGWNGTGPGFNNNCEWSFEEGKGYDTGKTKPEVIHAERNALDKLLREGVSSEGSILFVTTAPCIECAKSIAAVGITDVFYKDNYHDTQGIDHLKAAKIKVHKFSDTWL